MSVKSIKDMQRVDALQKKDLFIIETEAGTRSAYLEQIVAIINSLQGKVFPEFDITLGTKVIPAINWAGQGYSADGSDVPEDKQATTGAFDLAPGNYYFTNTKTLTKSKISTIRFLSAPGPISMLPSYVDDYGVILVRKPTDVFDVDKEWVEGNITYTEKERLRILVLKSGGRLAYAIYNPISNSEQTSNIINSDSNTDYRGSVTWYELTESLIARPEIFKFPMIDENGETITDEETGEIIFEADKMDLHFNAVSSSMGNQYASGVKCISPVILEGYFPELYTGKNMTNQCLLTVFSYNNGADDGTVQVRQVMQGTDGNNVPRTFVRDVMIVKSTNENGIIDSMKTTPTDWVDLTPINKSTLTFPNSILATEKSGFAEITENGSKHCNIRIKGFTISQTFSWTTIASIPADVAPNSDQNGMVVISDGGCLVEQALRTAVRVTSGGEIQITVPSEVNDVEVTLDIWWE